MSMTPDLSIIGRHAKPILQFSGGADSLACLWLLREHWPRLTVVWVNTGDCFPETSELMRKVRELVPHFHEVRSDQPAQIRRWGYPVDVLPIRSHAQMQVLM
jgi:3'-phosphoadenosine 5'-phosphosulfate sulfotransferase (PAPS reductase)/FAD synthetase